jgi:hypothetical protein
MNSLWTNKIYYMFGFLFLCYGLMIITTAATTVLHVYFLLCAEDYLWQWRAFAGAGMTGGYVFLNALIFWATRVSFGGLTGAVLYVGYSALIGLLVFILTGIAPSSPCLVSFMVSEEVGSNLHSQDRSASLPAGLSSTVFTVRLRLTNCLLMCGLANVIVIAY